MLADAGGVDLHAHDAALNLESGVALSPADAANCTRDFRRLSVFLRGLRSALAVARRRFGGQRLEIVYAGTGPLAPLAIPLMPFLGRDQSRFTFLDLFPESVESVTNILRRLRLRGFVRSVIEADATKYRHPRNLPLHIVLSETMQRSLAKEPQVAIMRNLAPQLTRGGFLIPQCVAVDLVAAAPIARVMEISARTARRRVNARIVTIPHNAADRYLALATQVRVFRRHVLRVNESGLTVPEVLWDFPRDAGGKRFAFSYNVNERPGLRWERL